jgi:AcrR family transcriptional regulator
LPSPAAKTAIRSNRRAAEPLGRKRERTRKRVLETAFKLIGHEKGLSLRVEDICAAAHISRQTFYHYFTSLEQLFEVLVLELSHDFNVALVSTLEKIETDAERSNAAIQHYLKRTRRDAAWGWAMVHLSAVGPILGAESYQACYLTIKRGIEAGEFDIPNATHGRDLLMGTVLAAMIATLRVGSAPSQPRIIAHHVLRALGVPDVRAREISESRLPEIVTPK